MAQKRLKGLTNGTSQEHTGGKIATIEHELDKTGHEPSPDLPDGFQMTELGPLPKEWRVVRLGDMAVFGRNKTTQQIKSTLIPFVPMSLLPEDTIYISQWEMRREGEIRSGIAIQNGDFLLAKITPCLENGKQGIVRNIPGGWGYATTEVIPIRPYPELHAEYLALYLKQPAIRQELAGKMDGTTGRQRLPKVVVQQLAIPLPPLPEQRAIAHVLRTVQRAKEATDGVIAALKELKKSLMQHLFTYGPVPVTEREGVAMQESEIGPIPAHWRVVRLGEVAQMKQGRVLPTSSFTQHGYPVYGANGCIGWFSTYTHAEEEVLVTCRGATCGTVNVSQPKSFITNNAMIVTPTRTDRLRKDYLAFALQIADLTSCITGSGQPQITKGKLALIAIPLPPLEEQHEIARMLQAVDAKIAAEQARRVALEDLFKTLLHELMSGRKRVCFTTEHTEDTER